MIRVADSILLATTKLKSRRVRLVITVVVSGLLFIGLFFASFIFNGSTGSIEKFSEDGFGKRFITRVNSTSVSDLFKLLSDPDFISQAKQADKDLIAAKTAEAKRLGIEYDSKSERLSFNENDIGPDGKPMASVTPQVEPILRVKKIEDAKHFFESIVAVQKEYNVKARYGMSNLIGSNFSMAGAEQNSVTMSVLKEGREVQSNNSFGPSPAKGLSSISQNLQTAEAGLLKTFLLPNQNLEVESDGAIPIIAPFSAAEEALGFSALPESASVASKLERVKQVRAEAAGLKFQVCIRNTASINRQSEADQLATEISRGKSKKDYIMPELVYVKSDKPCEDVKVSRDVRSAEAKKLASKQTEFDTKFGKPVAAQRIVDFKIVGIVSDPPEFGGFSAKTLISSLLLSSLGAGWFIPSESAGSLPEYKDVFDDIGLVAGYSSNVLLEFNNVDDAKKFIKEKDCKIDPMTQVSDVTAECEKKGTPFFLSSFGSNSMAMEGVKASFGKIFQKVGLVISAISIIIMMGTVGKVVADSRRETAVFRAIGAKRLDIAQIYLLYTLMLGLIVVIFACGIAWLLANILQAKYSSDLTIESLIAFNSTNLDRKFTLVGIDIRQLLTLTSFILGGALFSAIGPLLTNLKRNPIRDMRDER